MKTIDNSVTYLRAGNRFLASIVLSVLLSVFLAACSGGTAETPAPPAGSETVAAPPPAPVATPTAEQAQEAELEATEPAEPVATETPPEEAPTESAQEASTPPAGAGVNACDILTATEAEAYLGAAPAAPESPVEGEGMYAVSSCSYRTADNEISLIVTESVDKDPGVPAAAFESELAKSVENYGVEAVLIPGLGDMAAWISNPDWYVNNLDVVKGYYRFYLSTGGAKSDQPPPVLVEVAEMVLSKLP